MSYNFERLDVWTASRQFVKCAYFLSKKLPKEESFGLISQIRRAAVSVPANYVEGNNRVSYKDKAHFYEIAYGSLMEVYCHFVTAMDVGYDINTQDISELKVHVDRVASLLSGLRQSCLTKY